MIQEFAPYFLASLLVGLPLSVAGVVVLRSYRGNAAPAHRIPRWVAFPLIGCGGFILLGPLLAIGSMALIFGGVVAFCSNDPSC